MKYLPTPQMRWPSIALCLNEASFDKEMKRLKVKGAVWGESGSTACVVQLRGCDGDMVCIVCVHRPLEPADVISTLTHEAVHVVQMWLADLDEKSPGNEIMAYAVQSVSTALLAEYARIAS